MTQMKLPHPADPVWLSTGWRQVVHRVGRNGHTPCGQANAFPRGVVIRFDSLNRDKVRLCKHCFHDDQLQFPGV
jgi:hypothetical protein